MRIVSVATRTVRWAITGDGAARGRSERAAVMLEVRSERGALGLGEAAPLPGLSREALGDDERAVAGLAARVPFEVADREAAFDLAREAALVAPAARFAIETALIDALARERGVALATVLREPVDRRDGNDLDGAAARSARALADGSRTVPLAAVVDAPGAARRAFGDGIRCFKIKVGPSGDLDRVRAIAAAAPGATLRLDANRSWPRAGVAVRLAALAGLPIEYVEEPCADAHLLLSAPRPCKLALDESLVTLSPGELAAALGSPGLGALVLKPTLLGGLSAVLALAGHARRAGVAAIASHGLEGPIGTAACAELALALGGERAAGLARHPAIAGWRIEVGQLASDHVHATGAPGLGFGELDLAGIVRACETELDGEPGSRADRGRER